MRIPRVGWIGLTGGLVLLEGCRWSDQPSVGPRTNGKEFEARVLQDQAH